MNQNDEHLKLLSIFNYVVAVVAAGVALFPIIHLVIGLAMLLAPNKFDAHPDPMTRLVGILFVIFAALFILAGWTLAVVIFLVGRFLARRRHHTFCLTMAAVECLFMPFGTVLGVFTIMVLGHPSVKQMFAAIPPSPVV
jgi:hypothetical protein